MRPALCAGGVYLVLAVAYFHTAFVDPAHRVLGNSGDPTLFAWYLRWVPWAVAHGHNPLFSSWIYAPTGANLMWNTSVVLLAVVFAPVTALFGPFVTYDVLMTLGVALSGAVTFAALRRVAGLGAGAWAGGLLYAFSPYMVSQATGHLHQAFAVAVPAIALAAHEVFAAQRWTARRAGIVLGAVCGLQALTGEELLATAVIAVAIAVVWLAAVDPTAARRRLPFAIPALAWSGATFAAIAGGPVAFQVLGPQAVHGPVQQPGVYVADLLSWVTPTLEQWVHTAASVELSQRFPARGSEWSSYLGVPLIAVLIGIVVARRRDRAVRAAALTLGLLMVLALGPHLRVGGYLTRPNLPWAYVQRLPFMDDLLPVRLMAAGFLVVAGLVGLAVDAVVEAPWGVARVALAVGLAASAVTLIPRMPFPTVGYARAVPAVVRSVPAGRLAIVAPAPNQHDVETLQWQLAAGFRFRLAGGYALVPGDGGRPGFTGRTNTIATVLEQLRAGAPLATIDVSTRTRIAAELAAGKPGAVIVGPMANHDAVVGLFGSILRTPPAQQDGFAVWAPLPAPFGP